LLSRTGCIWTRHVALAESRKPNVVEYQRDADDRSHEHSGPRRDMRAIAGEGAALRKVLARSGRYEVEMPIRHIFPVLTILATLVAVQYAPAAFLIAAHTKAQAEVNVLRAVPRSWKASRMPGLIDPRTHLLVNNTEAVCHGRGKAHGGGRYTRFLCVVRPPEHRPRAGLNVSYRAFPHGRFRIQWLAYRR